MGETNMGQVSAEAYDLLTRAGHDLGDAVRISSGLDPAVHGHVVRALLEVQVAATMLFTEPTNHRQEVS